MPDTPLDGLEPIRPGTRVRIMDADAEDPARVDKGDLKEELAQVRERIAQLQRAFYADGRRALLVIFQGRDASGKDGVIRAVFQGVNPMGMQVTGFRKPTEEELAHDFLWRVHRAVPQRGMFGLFNRSHYEDVLVVRVHDLVPPEVWEQRYDQINVFERHLATNGVVILKFFLHISREEQRKRLIERLEDPEKNWKFNAGDLMERQKWDAYTEAYEAALSRCTTAECPWYLVPADRNAVRNVLVARTVAAVLERIGSRFPGADPEVLRLKETII
jgi:PPK2 family polyphosphate:nucleotide phosphotransferase